MAKFYGNICFSETVETKPGVWTQKKTIRPYFGDLVRNYRRLDSSNNLNDNINIQNDISIITDPYANKNFHSILYVEFMETKWKVETVEVQFPRLLLSLRGVYNE